LNSNHHCVFGRRQFAGGRQRIKAEGSFCRPSTHASNRVRSLRSGQGNCFYRPRHFGNADSSHYRRRLGRRWAHPDQNCDSSRNCRNRGNTPPYLRAPCAGSPAKLRHQKFLYMRGRLARPIRRQSTQGTQQFLFVLVHAGHLSSARIFSISNVRARCKRDRMVPIAQPRTSAASAYSISFKSHSTTTSR